MLNIEYQKSFLKIIRKIKDENIKEKIKKQIEKIIDDPETGKPMQFERKGTRELYISPYRLAYAFIPSENKLIFLDIYHKDEQ
jgi:mRNA-degrading endonuclease RelE of RelBE toxin-antitoxin system